MGAGASVTIQNEMTKPLDASDVATPRGESAKAEVIRLRRMIYDQQRAERLKCAVMGSMLCDAASSTLLWHYDPEKLKELVGDSDALFFPKEHTCDYLKAFQEHGHYNTPSSFSPFAQQNLCFLKSIKNVDKTKDIDGQAQTDAYAAWAKDFTGYKEYNVKMFESAIAEGKKYPDVAPKHACGEQAEHFGKAALCALKYRDQPKEFQEKQCKAFTLVSHTSLWAVELTLLQMKIILLLADGKGVAEALDQALTEVNADMQSEANPGDSSLKELITYSRNNLAKDGISMYKMTNSYMVTKTAWKDEISKLFPQYHPPEETMEQFAKITCINCYSLNGLLITVNILLQTTDWKEAMKLNVMTGGDSGGRGLFLGSCLGAINGTIPSDLVEKWEGYAATKALVEECAM